MTSDEEDSAEGTGVVMADDAETDEYTTTGSDTLQSDMENLADGTRAASQEVDDSELSGDDITDIVTGAEAMLA